MVEFHGVKHVLLDIEGTICSISFVKDTLFPYAISALPTVLPRDWDTPQFLPYREAFPPEHSTSPAVLQTHVEDLTARDVKVAPLKNLQGYLWEAGYKSGAYSTPLFADVEPKLEHWKNEGLELAIYSSGSVFAQKLLFGHVKGDGKDGRKGEDGGEENVRDLKGLIGGWFDTVNAGAKTERGSYEEIVRAQGWKPEHVLFLSDNTKETTAARDASMQVCVLEREGNAPLSEGDRKTFDVVTSLEDIEIVAAQEDTNRKV